MTTNETCRTMITMEKLVRFKQTTKCTTVVGTAFTSKAADILKFIAIVLWCCCYANAVDAQQLEQLEQHQQQQQKNYQQKYQHQQQNHMQQHYEYQQQMQLQQQYEQENKQFKHILQKQQEQASNQQAFHALLPITLPLKQQQQQKQQHQPQQQQQYHKQHEAAETKPNIATNMQLLKTGTSLIVADGQKEYYAAEEGEIQSPALRRRAGNRKRKRRPQITPNDETYIEDVADNQFNRNDTRQTLPGKRRKNSAHRETVPEIEANKPRKTNLPITERDKSYRRPYAQSKKEANSDIVATVPTTSRKNELKNILKNSAGNMSLSEILQQKNLSLDDLLKGKQNALLALQSTAVGPASTRQTDSNKQSNVVRRLPSLHSQSTTAQGEVNTKGIHQSSIINSSENIDANSSKNKLKFPTLQRLKLFGTSSRATISAEITTTKRREISTSTPATTLSTSISTTRIPLYKKRLQQRPTLKPPVLFKPNPSAPAPTNQNLLPSLSSILNSTEDTTPSENLEVEADIDEFLINHSTTSTLKPSKKSTKTISTTKTATTTTSTHTETEIPTTSDSEITKDTEIFSNTSPTTTTATTINANSVGSEQSTKLKSNYKQNEKESKISRTNYISINKGIQEHNLKSNSIENDDAQHFDDNNNNNFTLKPDVNSRYDDDDLENFFDIENSKEYNLTKPIENITPRIHMNIKEQQQQNSKNKHSNLVNAEFSDGVDDRTDLLELIEDRRSGTRLFKILEQRNMTLEELIEHRKRGSSQLHLKTVVQNQSGFFPGQKVILQDNMDIVTAFENFPHFNLMNLKSVKPDDIKTDSQGSSYFTSIIDIEPTDDADNGDGSVGGEGISNESGEYSRRSEKSVGFFPSWKTLALASLNNPANIKKPATKRNPFFFPQPKIFLENVSQDLDADDDKLLMDNLTNDDNNNNSSNTINVKNNDFREKIKLSMLADEDTVEAIENEVARAHDLLDLELSGHGFKRSPAAAASISNQYNNNVHTNMPAGIRSAIAASAAIVLTSLATFMIIFIVFRWKQRKRRKSSYMKTYNAMKSKMPALPINSRCSSARNMEEMMDGIATITQSPVHQLQRQSSLLFPRHSRDDLAKSTQRISGCTGSSLLGSCGLGKHEDSFDNDKRNKKVHHHHHRHHNNNNNHSNGLGSTTGSMTSLALSLQSAQNISSTKLNPMDTMDPNSPEVQEYLFDALRKSF